ncbi:efflux RND transporter periplasmic adaptor subunit [Chromobacterium subtsugae]|uniref:efflux RND transporter periplasmic adaptor subunit n=1 Tax=Chromobacterium subtsugae TaxID=251747 RepID=UPI000641042F|nr:efflux RND transporter periplasmic adaptor subunit [Chromobacterium subtsugae]
MVLKRRYLLGAACAAALALAAAGRFATVRAAASAQPAATRVGVAQVAQRTVTDWQSYSGRLEPVAQVDVRPQVSGTIAEVHFRDGELVKKGAALFTIDPRPYQAAVERLAAEMAAARARSVYAAAEQERARKLLADNAIAKRDFDARENAAREAEAGLQAARAALSAARLDLEHTRIAASIAGRVSRAELTVGNVVAAGPGAPALTRLVSVSPMYAAFNVDEQAYLRYLRGAREKPVPVLMGLADEGGQTRRGQVASIDNRLDAGSGTIRVRARFDNSDGSLLPGLFARIRLGGGAPHAALLVPDEAVGTDQDKRYVLVVDAGNRVQYREVGLGPMQQGLREVSSGLKPGERIVIDGLQRVRPGEIVAPENMSMAVAAAGDGQ